MGATHEYNPIDGDENKEGFDIRDEPQHKQIKTPIISSWWKLLLCHLLAACVGAGAMFLFTHSFNSAQTSTSVTTPATSTDLAISTQSAESIKADIDPPPNMEPGLILDCGYSVEEARAKGCVYDVMMQDWVPEPCYDSVLTERYLAMGNWTWYIEGDGSKTISLEDMRKGEHGHAWMATSYHKEHCVFSWLKIIRALRNNRGISQELLSYDHVLHCAHGALKSDSNDQGLGVSAPTNYAKCALYNTWRLDFIPDKHNSTQR